MDLDLADVFGRAARSLAEARQLLASSQERLRSEVHREALADGRRQVAEAALLLDLNRLAARTNRLAEARRSARFPASLASQPRAEGLRIKFGSYADAWAQIQGMTPMALALIGVSVLVMIVVYVLPK